MKTTKKSGRVTTDERGNSTWEWQTDTGSFKREIDTEQLKVLQESQLSVADTTAQQSGFDPYNNSNVVTPAGTGETATKPPKRDP